MASPRSFNDPFDSAIPYNFDDPSGKKEQRWISSFARRTDKHRGLSKKRREDIIKSLLREKKLNPFFESINDDIFENVTNNMVGICSLSSKRDDILMWSHYTNSHAGVCIGLSTKVLGLVQENLFLNKRIIFDLEKVNYSDSIPSINFYDSMIETSNSTKDLQTILLTKSNQWSYEDEYRLFIHRHPDQVVAAGPKLISCIILGCKMSKDDEDAVMRSVKLNGSDCKVYKAKKCRNRFGLDMILQD